MQVCNQKNWSETVDVSELKQIRAVPMGSRHRPINHGECLDMFMNTIIDRNLTPTCERGLLSKDKMKYVFVVDINNGHSDYTFTLGFCNYNNQQKALTGIAGEKVFICSNEMYTGELQNEKRRHTTNVIGEIYGLFSNLVEYFKRFTDKRDSEINRLKTRELNNKDVGEFILDMHRDSGWGNTNIGRLVSEWDNPRHEEFKPRTAWSLQNAGTEVLKLVKDPTRRIDLGKDMHNRIARFVA